MCWHFHYRTVGVRSSEVSALVLRLLFFIIFRLLFIIILYAFQVCQFFCSVSFRCRTCWCISLFCCTLPFGVFVSGEWFWRMVLATDSRCPTNISPVVTYRYRPLSSKVCASVFCLFCFICCRNCVCVYFLFLTPIVLFVVRAICIRHILIYLRYGIITIHYSVLVLRPFFACSFAISFRMHFMCLAIYLYVAIIFRFSICFVDSLSSGPSPPPLFCRLCNGYPSFCRCTFRPHHSVFVIPRCLCRVIVFGCRCVIVF